MNGRKRIACFFTCGYTEYIGMVSFLRKINADVEYVRQCPSKKPKSRKAIIERQPCGDRVEIQYGGMTGRQLIEYVLTSVGKGYFKREIYDALLIEDDRDRDFLSIKRDGTSVINHDAWIRFKKDVEQEIRKQLPGIPVMFLCASPEIEIWFTADWDKGFGSLFDGANRRHSIPFRKFLMNNVLTDAYCNCLEDYGYFDGVYRKYSEEVVGALESYFISTSTNEEVTPIHYSKCIKGTAMLESIEPQKVKAQCAKLFAEAYRQLAAFGKDAANEAPESCKCGRDDEHLIGYGYILGLNPNSKAKSGKCRLFKKEKR